MLKELNITNFRNINQASISFTKKFSLFYGANGSGKTSVLEAVYFLAFGRSFRAPSFKKVINFGNDSFIVSAKTQNSKIGSALALEKSKHSGTQVFINHNKALSFVELSQLLPVQTLNSTSAIVLEGEPSHRRGFLDWGLFHVEHGFLDCWKNFKKILLHRNALLKADSFGKLERHSFKAWNSEFLKYASAYDSYRMHLVKMLSENLVKVVNDMQIFTGLELKIRYKRGWKQGISLEEALYRAEEQDFVMKTSTQGPHRADLVIEVNGKPAKFVLSRGQAKLLVFALNFAAAALLVERSNQKSFIGCEHSIFLIDDLAAELDSTGSGLVLEYLHSLPNQVLITNIEKPNKCPISVLDIELFHVEHGNILQKQ